MLVLVKYHRDSWWLRKTSASKCANEIVDLLVHEIVLANLTLIC